MDWESYQKHKPYAGKKKPSMLRRRVGHDYESRCIYLITLVVEGRRQLLGRLIGNADAAEDSPDRPRIELTQLGFQVKRNWQSIGERYPEIKVLAITIMPDHLHGILFVERHMAQHLGMVIKGFKIGCNKAYRQLYPMLQQCCSTEDINDRSHGYLWARNYNDHILDGKDELDRWFKYLKDNPRRLAIKRAHPEFFTVRFGITVAGQTYSAIGNRFLLDYPNKQQVQCSRSLTEEQVAQATESVLAKARQGAVLVSPAISHGEPTIMRAALDAHLPLIYLTRFGFNQFSHPGNQFYQACAEGRFLILSPWEHQNQRPQLTREISLMLNDMAASICRE